MKLAMTLLVRDEVDIIEENIRYHAAQGVDYFVVMDNGSVDGTKEKVARLKKIYEICLIENKKHSIDQDLWVTDMCKVALDRYKADWVINADADEFFYPINGTLKDIFENSGYRVVYCNRFNMLPQASQVGNANYRFYDNVLCVSKPYENQEAAPNPLQPLKHPIMLRRVADKCVCALEGLNGVEMGNHDVDHDSKERGVCKDIAIFHFPVRTYGQFQKKIRNYGESLLSNRRFHEGVSWHLRRLYKQFLAGSLEHEYKNMLIQPAVLDGYLDKGLISYNYAIRQAMIAISGLNIVNSEYKGEDHIVLDGGKRFFLPSDSRKSDVIELYKKVLAGDEYPLLPHLKHNMSPNIVDVGANIGAFCLFIKANYPFARIDCYEPVPENVKFLRVNCKGLTNVHIHNYGLYQKDTKIKMYSGISNLTHSIKQNRLTKGSYATVDFKDAQRELFKNGPIDCLKIDTEGCEVGIIDRIKECLSSIKSFYIEYHSEADRIKIDELLHADYLLSYSRSNFIHRGILCYVRKDIASHNFLDFREIK